MKRRDFCIFLGLIVLSVCGGVKEAKDDDERRKGKQREMDGWMEGWTMFSRLWRAGA